MFSVARIDGVRKNAVNCALGIHPNGVLGFMYSCGGRLLYHMYSFGEWCTECTPVEVAWCTVCTYVEVGCCTICIPVEVGWCTICTPVEVGCCTMCTPVDVGWCSICTPVDSEGQRF